MAIGFPWVADVGDGTYQNPVLCADYSDPDVTRDGDDFWMTASSFANTPGLPILHSRDLVNWTLVNHAILNLPDASYAKPRTGCGVWAPAIRKHDGKFWIFFPTPDEGIYVTTAEDPRGKWSEPWLLLTGKGLIDPCPLWDEDGKAYLIHAYAKSRAGIKDILRVRPMSPDGKQILGEGQIVIDADKGHVTLEGPKFHKWNGFYYISAPAGGVATGWQVVFRSKNIFGPYEEKIVLKQGSTPINGPHQGAIIDTAAGEWWFMHFQDAGVYGRITHLQPVVWREGWPVMGIDNDGDGCGEPVLRHRKPKLPEQPVAAPATSDEFQGSKLGLQWQWEANFEEKWASLTERPGLLRLHALPAPADLRAMPNILAQKLPARSFSVETEVQLTGTGDAQAGLVLIGKKHAALVIENKGPGSKVVLLVNNEPVESWGLDRPNARLRMEMKDGGLCSFSFAATNEKSVTARTHFQAVEGHWVGTRVGIFARSLTDEEPAARADFEFFRFAP